MHGCAGDEQTNSQHQGLDIADIIRMHGEALRRLYPLTAENESDVPIQAQVQIRVLWQVTEPLPAARDRLESLEIEKPPMILDHA